MCDAPVIGSVLVLNYIFIFGRRHVAHGRFDILVVAGSDLGLILEYLGVGNVGALATLFRTFRIGRY